MMEISGDLCEWRKFRGISLVITLPLSLSLSHPPSPLHQPPQSDEAVRMCLKERGHSVLVLQRMSSEQTTPSASSGAEREEARDRR